MINFLCGDIVNVIDGKVIIKNGNIGYELYVSSNTASKLCIGDSVQLFCYLQVKEDGLSLYGFYSQEEKALFQQLTSVSGIGPKNAITILSGMQPEDLGCAIFSADTTALCSIKGLGKKTAERIVLELREKMAIFATNKKRYSGHNENSIIEEAVSVLCSLGLNSNSAIEKANAAYESGANTTEQILNYVLRGI